MTGHRMVRVSAFFLAGLALLVVAGETQAQRFGGRPRGFYPNGDYYPGGYRPGFAYPQDLATPYSTWYSYYPENYRYPRPYGTFAPSYRMYANPYGNAPAPVSVYGPRVGTQPVMEMAPTPTQVNAALVKVSVPADAEVLFDGTKTNQTGASRVYETPVLTPGKEFSYEVTARWQHDGKEVKQTKTVTVKANGIASVAFAPADKEPGE